MALRARAEALRARANALIVDAVRRDAGGQLLFGTGQLACAEDLLASDMPG